ncbi:hypothetical protein [Myxococcus sp. RHSTA-1-4]|uniref:hypothetical protein n=1 Tax=Myxococcus sp. RHSTA-1-4 TaxID=2874601 RepID=UPI001CBB4C45|nr:hypothetical protein [Myxococcus sp. RHSTA-1-4]MBZ4422022.1 hypothetical protein [Myxococcus sp. RHSTA-1-4]
MNFSLVMTGAASLVLGAGLALAVDARRARNGQCAAHAPRAAAQPPAPPPAPSTPQLPAVEPRASLPPPGAPVLWRGGLAVEEIEAATPRSPPPAPPLELERETHLARLGAPPVRAARDVDRPPARPFDLREQDAPILVALPEWS